ncbi:hypothetical protein [Natrononativus amylolyticus]|nr:hypothetical protein [Natrononativus amylolyticus]
MSSEEFRDDVRSAIRRHEQNLEAEDLREIAQDLKLTADNWEQVAV